MGNSSSKSKQKPKSLQPKHFRPDYDYPSHYWPQPAPNIPPYGYPYGNGHAQSQQGYPSSHRPVIPPGYMPNYPPGPQMPQPHPAAHWPPAQPSKEPMARREERVPRERKKKRKKTRRRTPTATLTFSAANNAPQPSATAPVTQAFEPYPQPAPSNAGAAPVVGVTPVPTPTPTPTFDPVIPSTARAVTPSPAPSNRGHKRRPTSIQIPPPSGGGGMGAQHAVAHVTTQPPAASSNPRPHSPSKRSPNPLPEPPRDIFASTPYKHLLAPKTLPPTTGFIPTTTTLGQTVIVQEQKDFNRSQTTEKEKKHGGGLFSALSWGRSKSTSKPRERTVEKEVRYVFVPQAVPPPLAQQQQQQPEPSPTRSATHSRRASATREYHDAGPGTASASGHGHQHDADSHSHPRSATPSQPPIYFNQSTPYYVFLNHSPHPVCYERVDYPTATHLLEALKFLPERPDVAETIRRCEDTGEVYQIGAEFAGEAQGALGGQGYLDMMETVVYLKFNQHADLGDLLLSTGSAPLAYDDPSDSYWGIGVGMNGEPGKNELGKLMERIRERVRRDRVR